MIVKTRLGKLVIGSLLAATSLAPANAATPADPLAAGFADPPNGARPRVWWHWMNGNITKDGILKDMEWMKRAGIGGLQNFDANLATPQIVAHRLVYMHSDWKDAFAFAAKTADQLGLELAIASSPGWSETGGPWVRPEDGLKKLVWSSTTVSGGRRFVGKLPNPPSITGPFQTLRLSDPFASIIGLTPKEPPTYYADVAVLAVPVDAGIDAIPKLECGDKSLDAAKLADGDLETVVGVPRGTAQRPTVLSFDYGQPTTIRSATIFVGGPAFSAAAYTPILEANVGGSWLKIASLPLDAVPTTVGFAPISAQHFRVILAANSKAAGPDFGDGAPGAVEFNFTPAPAPDTPLTIGELKLSGDAKVDRFEQKAGFSVAEDYYALSKGVDDASGADPSKVIDLTGRLKPDGTLDWTPPEGTWRVIRFGYSLLGTTNHPASPEATGLEVDKFDGTAVRRYLDTYMAMYRDASSGLIGDRGVRAFLTDSIEVGAANWTPGMVEQFRRLRGYDPTPWLPALTGEIIGSRAQSDKFLYDFRRTIADLMSSQHYGTVAAVAHENHLKLYGEALESGRPSLGDDMAMRHYTDVPMSALWSWGRDDGPRPTLLGDMKGASSVAHLYGQNLAAAESMTSANAPWAFAPHDLRRYIDLEFAEGINRPVIHTSVHQPTDDKLPGLSLAIFGQYFNRHETWAEMARPWVDYIARNSFMLQQGRNFADVAYFYGEESPLTALFDHAPLADLPTHYAYDFVNPDVLANQLGVDNGELVARSGARYRVLYLGGTSEHMTLAVLRRVATLVDAGATVVGNAPASSPSLKDSAAEFADLQQKLWSGQPVTRFGKGRVIAGLKLESALQSIGIPPDLDVAKAQPDGEIMFVHRRLTDGDLYYVDNRKERPETLEARFRVTGRAPEIWHADTGLSEPVSYRTENGVTAVPLELDPEESFFVVFRKPAPALAATVSRPAVKRIAEIGGPWTVSFQPDRGAPASTTLSTLASLSENPDPAIRYFSGIATYKRGLRLPAGVRPGSPLWLDLGAIGDVAEVRVNGALVGTAWHAPYRVNIGRAVHRGSNQLEVRVADLWVNRLIGDSQPGARKITWTAVPTYKPDAPLRPSGLIGPVSLSAQRR